MHAVLYIYTVHIFMDIYVHIFTCIFICLHTLIIFGDQDIHSSVATSEGCLKFKGNSRTMVIRHLLKVIQLFFFCHPSSKKTTIIYNLLDFQF